MILLFYRGRKTVFFCNYLLDLLGFGVYFGFCFYLFYCAIGSYELWPQYWINNTTAVTTTSTTTTWMADNTNSLPKWAFALNTGLEPGGTESVMAGADYIVLRIALEY